MNSRVRSRTCQRITIRGNYLVSVDIDVNSRLPEIRKVVFYFLAGSKTTSEHSMLDLTVVLSECSFSPLAARTALEKSRYKNPLPSPLPQYPASPSPVLRSQESLFKMKAISTLLVVATLFATAFAQVETGSPAAPAAGAEVDAGYSSTCCSDIFNCSDNEFPCPHEHGHHDHPDHHRYHGHDHGQHMNQYIAPFPTPVFQAPECTCHDPVPECVHTCREYCQTCYYEEPCPTCEFKKDPCPPYCQLYTTTATYEYPYTTLSATETCTMTLLSCENEVDRYEPYTQYPDHCEYQYPCHTPYAYEYAHPPKTTITATVVPIVKFQEHKHDDRHRIVAEPALVEGGW